jgi:hypothetical protein
MCFASLSWWASSSWSSLSSSSSSAPHHFLHSFHTANYVLEKPPSLMWKPKGSPKSHPVERSIISHASQSTHSPDSTLFLKSLNPKNLPNYFCRLCLWSLTPTTTAITIIIILSNHKDDDDNNNNPIKVGWKDESCYFRKYLTKGIPSQTSWCGVELT